MCRCAAAVAIKKISLVGKAEIARPAAGYFHIIRLFAYRRNLLVDNDADFKFSTAIARDALFLTDDVN